MDELLTTGELATRLGVTADNLRKWKARGHLKLEPKGTSGQGRSVECMWSPEAQEEARWYRDHRTNGPGWKARAPIHPDNERLQEAEKG
jgi:hypothetical protein